MKKDNNNLFWVGYADIMTSLFFIMLVLFVVTTGYYYSSYQIAQEKLDEIDSIETALSSLDRNFFDFNDESKRYRLNIPVEFRSNSDDIYVADDEILDQLQSAGQSLYNRLDSLLAVNKDAHLLLVIEGNTQRYADNWINYADRGYRLSYNRALALYNYWDDKGLDFRDLTKKYDDRLELIISGSGYFGLSREVNESLNRRFTLQITSKYTLEAS